MSAPSGHDTVSALADRLREVAGVLLDELPVPSPDPAEHAARLLMALAESTAAEPTNERIWILLAGVASAYPTRDEVDQARRSIELMQPEEAAVFLLDSCLATAAAVDDPTTRITVVTDEVLVDVDFTARHDLHTGIQRVVRQTLPLWDRDHRVTPVVWGHNQRAMRRLFPSESDRIFHWFGTDDSPADDPSRPDGRAELIIPWRCLIVLVEVPPLEAVERLAAIGACSTNSVAAIGYDMIPLVSADTVDATEPRKFMPYLAAIKFADRVAGISQTAADEFASFTKMLASQGLRGPDVRTVALPAAVHTDADGSRAAATAPPIPTVVVVGSHDHRKNHLAILHAAEILWQEGLTFALVFIGGGGSNVDFYRRVEILQNRSRPVSVRIAIPEDELQEAVRTARFTVFPSIHEGYGLPVAESMALGTPVITTEYGSTAEIAQGGGALLVDPRSDDSIASAMRRLLSDDAELDRLRSETRRRAERSWQDYADELWNALVAPFAGANPDNHVR